MEEAEANYQSLLSDETSALWITSGTDRWFLEAFNLFLAAYRDLNLVI